jgi:hypothetical protein
MSTALRIVTSPTPAEAEPRSLGERVRLLQMQARGLAREHVDALMASLQETRIIAEDIAAGGDAYPPGVRDLARRLAEDSAARARTLEAIASRA